MPTYDYACDACGHEFELFQSFSDPPVQVCPNCNGPVRRIIAPTPVIFKGTGWYTTDSKRQTAGLSAGKSTTAKSDEKGENKGEDKTEATPPTAEKPAPKPTKADSHGAT